MKVRHIVLSLSILAASSLVLVAYAQKRGLFSSSFSSKGKRGEDSAQIIRARENWFYRQRAYPLPRIPAGARQQAWQQFLAAKQQRDSFLRQKFGADYTKPAAAAALAAGVVNTAATWAPIGPQPSNDFFFQPYVSGRVTAMVVDPCDSTGKTVFLGGAQGGVWLTTNGGTTWSPLTDSAASLAIGSLAVPPSTAGGAGCVSNGTSYVSKTVYVGTGEENFSYDSYYGAGVLTCTTTNGSTYACTPDKTFGAFNAQSQPLTPDSGGAYIGGLAVDPQNPSILLAAVQGYQSVLPSGIWCSDNAGVNWTHVAPSVTQEVGTGVAFDSTGFGYAAIGNTDGGASLPSGDQLNGVYKTTAAITSCASPQPAFTNLGGLNNIAGGQSAMGRVSISVYSGSSNTSDEIFAAIANASDDSSTLLGIFKSTNGGSSWSQSDPNSSLVTSSGGFCNNQCFYDIPISIDPRNQNVIYAGGSAPNSSYGASIIASTDGGNTWTDVSNNSCSTCFTGPHVDTHAFAFTPTGDSNDLVYVGNDGGAWSTTSPESPSTTQTWTNLNATLALTQVYPGVSNDPGGWTYRSFLGSQDNGTQVFGQQSVSALPLSWDNTLSCGDGAATLVDPLIPSTVYTECAYIPGVIGGVLESVQNGSADDSATAGTTTFFSAYNGINLSDPGNFITPLAIDPEATGSTGDAQTLYFGTIYVYQTTNGAVSWNEISPDLSGDLSNDSGVSSFCAANPGYCALTAIGVAPKNSNEVATGSNAADLYLSTNATQGTSATWTEVGTPSTQAVGSSGTSTLPPSAVTDVAMDGSGNLYATYSGFSGNFTVNSQSVTIPPGHVFYGLVANSGGTPTVAWTDVSSAAACATGTGSLPNIPVNSIVVDPDNSGQLFVGTDVGVYVGELQGASPAFTGGCWQPLGSGLPNSAVLSLSLNDASRTLLAGTHGRSVWALALGDQPAFSLGTLSPASSNAGGPAFTMKLVGQGFTSGSTVNWTVGGTTPSGCAVSVTSEGATTTPFTGQSATQITASVPAACIALGGVASVSVSDSTQTPSTTNALEFTVTSSTPTVNSISPVTGAANNSLAMTLTGTGFASNSTVGLQTELGDYACNPIAGTSNSGGTQLTANITAACLQYGGVFFVNAINPAPGGGSSNPNLIAAPSPYGTACTGMNPPGCLLTVTGTTPSNANFSTPTAISSSGSITEDTSGASSNAPSPGPTSVANLTIDNYCGDGAPLSQSGVPDNGAAKAVWFSVTPSATTTAEFDTIGSSYDTILSVWTGSSINNLTAVACNDDISLGVVRTSQISNLTVNGGTTYYIMVSTFGVPILNSSGSLVSLLPDGGKLVLNSSLGAVSSVSFTAGASSPNPGSVSPGSSSSVTLTLTPQSGSTGTVNILPCTNTANEATITCSYSSSSVNLNGSAAPVTVTINTVSNGALPPGPLGAPPIGWLAVLIAAASVGIFLLMRRNATRRALAGAAGGFHPVPLRASFLAALGFALLAGMLIFQSACGGGGSTTPPPTGTPPGNYTITIPTSPAATNGNQSVTLTVL